MLFASSSAKFLPNCFFFLEKRHFVSHRLQSEGINCDEERYLLCFWVGRFECEMGWIDGDGNEIDDVPSQDDDEEEEDF